jgi:CRP-like cAMP-binding protein
MNIDVRSVLSSLAPVSEEATSAFLALTHVKTFGPGEWLLRGGEKAVWCYLIEEGLARELYIDPDGTEHTRTFVSEGHMTGSLLDLLSGGPSVTWIEALEPTTARVWSWAELDRLTVPFPELQLLLRRGAERLYVRKARREYEMLALSAAERYERWLAEHPGLDARVQRRHVASYLGITPEHLSRLRRTPSRSARARARSS